MGDTQGNKGDICSDVETDGVYPPAREACPTSCGVGSCSLFQSTLTPTLPPTAPPTFPPTASPTVPPTTSPTNAINCVNGEKFYAQAGSRVFTKPCEWLSVGKRTIYCDRWMHWGEINGVVYGPPAFVCPELCGSCDPCYQLKNTMFYYKKDNTVKNCDWLDRQSKKGDICSDVETDGVYPSAREACPTSCGVGFC